MDYSLVGCVDHHYDASPLPNNSFALWLKKICSWYGVRRRGRVKLQLLEVGMLVEWVSELHKGINEWRREQSAKGTLARRRPAPKGGHSVILCFDSLLDALTCVLPGEIMKGKGRRWLNGLKMLEATRRWVESKEQNSNQIFSFCLALHVPWKSELRW